MSDTTDPAVTGAGDAGKNLVVQAGAGKGNKPPKRKPTSGELCARVDRTRSVTGLFAVMIGDVAIAVAAIIGIAYISGKPGSSQLSSQIVAILSGGFTAIGTMTTAYFGIKSISNATSNIAQSRSRKGSGK
jgi:hypothetical protein